MTVQNTPNFVDYVGDDVTTVFNFTFRVDDIAWLSVDFTDDFDTFAINVDQDASPGGSATYLVAPPSPGMGGPDPSFRVLRTTPQAQLLAYTRYDPFDSLSHEGALDRLTMQVQDQVTFINTGDAFLQAQVDTNFLLITTGISPGHQHVVADLTDFGLHTDPTQDENITGQWDFINAGGIRVFDAGFVNGIQFSVATGFFEALALGAVVGFRSNGALQITELGVVANSLTITHDGVDVNIVGANVGDIDFSGLTGRLTQGAEQYAFSSEIVAAGLLPPPVANQILISDGASWLGSTNLTWDAVNRELRIGSSVASQVAIRIVPTQTNNYIALRMEDQAGQFFQIEHDFALSSANQELNFQSSAFGTWMEVENEGNMYLGGTESSARLKILVSAPFGDGEILLDNGATLYMEEIAAAQPDNLTEGQWWVRDDDPNTPMFTGDTGIDYVLNLVGASTAADRMLRADGSGGWVESPHIRATFSGILQIHGSGLTNSWLFTNTNTDGVINTVGLTDLVIASGFTRIRSDVALAILEAAAAPADVLTYGQFWVRNTLDGEPMFTDDQGVDTVLGAGITAPIVLLDNEQLQFGAAQDVTMDWDGTAFEVEGLASAQAWNFRDGMEINFFGEDNIDRLELSVQSAANTAFLESFGINSLTMGIGNYQVRFSDTGGTNFGQLHYTGGEFQISTGSGDGDIVLFWQGVQRSIVAVSNIPNGVTSGGTVLDSFSNVLPIGFNLLFAEQDNPVGLTLGAIDAGHMILMDDDTAFTVTIPASSNTDFPVGAITTLINANSAAVDITINDDATGTLFYLDGATVTDIAGTATIVPGGVANIWRRSTTEWFIWGTGVVP